MDKEIYDYIKNGITINGNPIDGYTVFTIPTQHFKMDSLHQLIPETFENAIKRQKEIDKTTSEMFSLIYDESIDWKGFIDGCYDTSIDKLYHNFIQNPSYKSENVSDLLSSQAGQLVKYPTKEDFIKKLLNDDVFYKVWGENSCDELSYEERYYYWFSHNFETGMEYHPQIIPDFDNDYYEPTPKRKLKE